MKHAKKISLLTLTALSLALAACQEEPEDLGRGDRTVLKQPGGPGGKVVAPGGEHRPLPTIIEQYYPAELADYVGTKAWRIEWPADAAGVDPEKIRTFFSISTGGLNNLQYMNSIDPLNKKKLSFSLFTDTRLKAAAVEEELWGGGPHFADVVYFGKIDKSLDAIKGWVTTRPSAFEHSWADTEDLSYDVEYQEGDFYIYQISDLTPVQYGGIRIVSEDPRIIEVYHAVNR